MFCERTKEFLSKNRVAFDERDVTSDTTALDELKRLGAMTTPVTIVDGDVIIGFDTDKLRKALEL